MEKTERDAIEASLLPNRRFRMPPDMTDDMRGAAYRSYCAAMNEKGYVAWEDICKCFVAAFDAAKR